jgi:starch synthase
MEGLAPNDVKDIDEPNYVNLTKLAMNWSDAVIQSSATLHADVDTAFKSLSKPTLGYQNPEEYIEAYDNFYDEAVIEDSVLAE